MQKKILIVEDELIIAKVYSLFLQSRGFSVLGTCSNADQAFRLLEGEQPDLVIMDIQLAGNVNGIEIARQIRTKNNTPIIFTTGNSSVDTMKRTREITNTLVLSKPIDNQMLLEHIEKIMN
jgi:DNA-binding response OmpR family regulator